MSFEGTGSPRTVGGQVGRQVCELLADGAHPALGCSRHTWSDTCTEPDNEQHKNTPCVCVCVCVCVLTCPTDIAHQAPWDSPGKDIGVPFRPPGGFSNPGIKPVSPALASREGPYIYIHTHTYISHVNLYTLYKSPKIPEGEIWGLSPSS